MLRLIPVLSFVVPLLFASTACQSSEPEGPEGLLDSRTVVDLSYAFDDSTIYWPTAPQEFELNEDVVGDTESGYYYAAYTFSAAEHGGTHMDAPKHFSKGGLAIHEVPVQQLIGPAVVVDVSEQALDNPDYRITVEDLTTWEADHGRIPQDAFLIFRTGYGPYYPDREQYMGTDERGEEALDDLHFPGLHPNAAQWLVDNRSIAGAGLDTPSIDYGQSEEFRAHRALFKDDVVVLENLANLDRLPPTGFHVLALPMKVRGGSGGPVRALALLREDG